MHAARSHQRRPSAEAESSGSAEGLAERGRGTAVGALVEPLSPRGAQRHAWGESGTRRRARAAFSGASGCPKLVLRFAVAPEKASMPPSMPGEGHKTTKPPRASLPRASPIPLGTYLLSVDQKSPWPCPACPPPPPPPAFSSFGRSATRHSVVSMRAETDAAFCRAVRTTFTGSMTPMPSRLP